MSRSLPCAKPDPMLEATEKTISMAQLAGKAQLRVPPELAATVVVRPPYGDSHEAAAVQGERARKALQS